MIMINFVILLTNGSAAALSLTGTVAIGSHHSNPGKMEAGFQRKSWIQKAKSYNSRVMMLWK